MENQIIHNLTLLSEMFDHQFGKLSNSVEAVNSVNKIIISNSSDGAYSINYNVYDRIVKATIEKEKIYDFYHKLLIRDKAYEIIETTDHPITINDWFRLEGSGALNTIKRIESELNYDKVKFLHLDGKRINVKYYQGILLLEDKQKTYLTNVIEFQNAAQQSAVASPFETPSGASRAKRGKLNTN